ncbi:hypothetical protein PgNI_06557 [Pyricularia grisea]|uniref:FAD-binding PCMH-type domain-containing protein n=1 Tax=Pyricularia grisea TaxID=148305 RepID=A0A6P8B6F8_PYRGI|nr:hypothetical protein PgNI_06557 [Pyricularia grisea]TLD10902.1 hypothetical protein PgNI_06557 [Pyricularia grisea]
MSLSLLLVALSFTQPTNALPAETNLLASCKPIPGDSAWPSQTTWNTLNETLNGRLIASIPQAAICHPGGYSILAQNATACESLTKTWDSPLTAIDSPVDIMNPWYQNGSCSPFYNLNNTCKLGNYASYMVNVSRADDVMTAIKFARSENVRLVIKNTGHDFLGKSTGKGALSLWTRNLRNLSIIPAYTSQSYTGPAVKIGVGLSGAEVLMAVSKQNYRIVSGDCPTVGIAGGYSAGGGHGALNNVYGLAADNVLEWEVVTADGRHLVATPQENADLYWAMTGGGAGTFAVALSMTTRLHQDAPLAAATLSFNASASKSNESYEAALEAWWKFLPTLVDTGAAPAFNLYDGGFLVFNTTASNQTAQGLAAVYKPYLSTLESLSVPYTFNTYTAPSYFAHYDKMYGPLPVGPYLGSPLFNSRLVPRGAGSDPKPIVQSMLTSMRLDKGADWQFGCMGISVSSPSLRHADNAVAPFWRDAVAICLEFSNYNWTIPEAEMLARRTQLADVVHKSFVDATPGSGAYLNEADPLVYPAADVKKWQDAFYGGNYGRLREIKNTWDPEGIFYAFTAVGSEDWVTDGEGRLCKA